MSDEMKTEGPTGGQSAPAGGMDPAKDAALEAEGTTTEPTSAPVGETSAETVGDDTPAEATEQPEPTQTPDAPADESPAGEETAE